MTCGLNAERSWWCGPAVVWLWRYKSTGLKVRVDQGTSYDLLLPAGMTDRSFLRSQVNILRSINSSISFVKYNSKQIRKETCNIAIWMIANETVYRVMSSGLVSLSFWHHNSAQCDRLIATSLNPDLGQDDCCLFYCWFVILAIIFTFIQSKKWLSLNLRLKSELKTEPSPEDWVWVSASSLITWVAFLNITAHKCFNYKSKETIVWCLS